MLRRTLTSFTRCQGCEGQALRPILRLETMFTVLLAALLLPVVYAMSTVAILLVVRLPEQPILRYAALALPNIAAVMVVTEWYDGPGLRMASSPRVEPLSTEDPMRSDQAA
jgi:hypothetical protein